jgi:hypothetical protein
MAHRDWELANAVIQGRMTLEEALRKMSTNTKRSRDFLALMFRRARTGQMNKGFGEGSKGGNVIGHTASGKPIYDRSNHAGHKDFTAADHGDAFDLQDRRATSTRLPGNEQERAGRAASYHEGRQSSMEDESKYGPVKGIGGAVRSLNKGFGEGSKGGQVVGHTRSGKPIYDRHDHQAHTVFDADEHDDAADAHSARLDKRGSTLSKEDRTQAAKARDKHWGSADDLRDTAHSHATQGYGGLSRSTDKGGRMHKGYKNLQENALDQLAGRQSQIRPSDESFLRSYGLDQPTLRKAQTEGVCKGCGASYSLEKGTEGALCKNCEVSKSLTSWHEGDLG